MTKRIIKYISYGSIAIVTFIIGIFIVTEKNQTNAGAVYVDDGQPHWMENFVCTEGAPKDNHTAQEVVVGNSLWGVNAPHCHKGTWVYQGDDAGDGGSEYINYEQINQ